MLKIGPKFGKDYFKELLERIRSIRTSERRIWQQITDIFARKGSEVLVGDKVLRLFEEVSEDGKEDSRSVQD